MLEVLDTATDDWGIKVERVEVKDVSLPKQLQRAMAAEAEATREAKAKVQLIKDVNKIIRIPRILTKNSPINFRSTKCLIDKI